ncbi:MAG: hypothetical protein JOZ73_10970 [Solirubrobacterales bacterium]|nr:hypothetical protein [Solirubrobacterales bacterium]
MNGDTLSGSEGEGLTGPLEGCAVHEEGVRSGLRSELGTEPLHAPWQSS